MKTGAGHKTTGNRKINCYIFSVSLFALCALLSAPGSAAEGQQRTKISRIGFLAGSSSYSSSTGIETLRQALSELGYVEGKNITVEYRFAEGKLDRLPALAAELIRPWRECHRDNRNARGYRRQESDKHDPDRYRQRG